jgi:acyl carrier protein
MSNDRQQIATLSLKDTSSPIVPEFQEEENRSTSIPLSFGQERIWLHEQSASGSSIYNIPVAYHLTGKLNVRVLEQSLAEIVKRHKIMQATFSKVDGYPVQVIAPEVAVRLSVIDLQSLPLDQREAQAQKLATVEAQQSFDLTQYPLWRFQLLRLGEEKHILLVTLHHIISDRWSLVVFMQELADLYTAFLTGNPYPLTELPKQYADFAISQRNWLNGQRWESQLAYWQKQLAGNISALKLPTDQTRPLISTYKGARQSFVLNNNLTEALKVLSEREDVTLFMTLLTAFQMLLYQYTQQEDMLICSPVAGRHRFQTKKLIGYFTNILPMRTYLGGNPTFQELLVRVRLMVLGAYKNLDLPFQAIADLPNLVRTPLTRGFFALQPTASQTPDLPGVTVDFEDIPNGTANFDFSLFMEETGETLTGLVDYKTDLFKATTISEMLEHFQSLLETLVANPDQPLLTLPIWRESEPEPTESYGKPKEEIPYVAPQKEIERKIAKVWKEVLQLEKVSIHSNFFELGGHSLAIARVVSKLREIFDKEISVIDLFQYASISEMAQYLSQNNDGTKSAFRQIQTNAQRQKNAIKLHKKMMKQKRNKKTNK